MTTSHTTNDPSRSTWVESARQSATDFPVQNLPLCRYIARGQHHRGVRIGEQLLSLTTLHAAGLISLDPGANWESLAGASPDARSLLRSRIAHLLDESCAELRDNRDLRQSAFVDVRDAELLAPIDIGNYTDFYASVYHATNVGSMMRPDNPLLPNYRHIPIGYHGRASSIVPSGTPVRRPFGQLRPDESQPPFFGPCRMLDYELEMGVLVSPGNAMGEPVSVANAPRHMLGLCLVNDWSARDIQRWEYQPLGPFLSKSFATSISPYIVMTEALEPFRCAGWTRESDSPQPLPYLSDSRDRETGGFDVQVEVSITSESMRARGMSPHRLSRGNLRHMYWSFAQMIGHHTSNGCNLRHGDLLASGTISGPSRDSRGCLLELTWDGDPWANPPVSAPGSKRTPITLPSGEQRTFLADGDEVIIRGWCERSGAARIGFGECRGIVIPALPHE